MRLPVDLAAFIGATLLPPHAAGRRVREVPPGPVAAPSGEREVDELADALRYLDADDRDTWIRVGQALYTLGETGLALWSAWSATSGRFPGGDDLERFETFSGTRTSWQSVFNQATAAGWKNPRKLDPAAIFADSVFVAAPGGQAANAPALGPMPLPPIPAPPGLAIVPPAPPVIAPRLAGEDLRGVGGEQRAATLANVTEAIGPRSGLKIVHDEFSETLMIAEGGNLRPFKDADYGALRIQLERKGFKPPAADTMREAVAQVAETSRMDTAHDWVRGLVWDGTPRVDAALTTYYGAEDTAYARSVGAYLFTALAGRALVPGCQADMAVILVGRQGGGKTSGVKALAPTSGSFGVVDLAKRDADLSRQLRGKLVIEWAELRGLAGRDIEGLKAWISQRTEEWTPKWKEFGTSFDRRCIVVGTTNETELLDDPTGERRWLPITTGDVDVPGIERNREQLWAEGAVRFRVSGIAWQDAERLARDEHRRYKVTDAWLDAIADWADRFPVPRPGEMPSAAKNGAREFSLQEVASEALAVPIRDLPRRDQLRIGKHLRALGFAKFTKSDSVTSKKLWRKEPSLSNPKGARA